MNWQPVSKPSLFFSLNFNVYTDVDSRKIARERDKEIKETNSLGRKTWKFYSGGENIRNTSGHNMKMTGSEKSEKKH